LERIMPELKRRGRSGNLLAQKKKLVIPDELKARLNAGQASAQDYAYSDMIGKTVPGWTPEARKLKWGRSRVRASAGAPRFDDKLFEMELLNKYAPEAGIRSLDLNKFLKDKGIRITKSNPEEGLRAAQKALRAEFPQGFFMKPIAGDAA
jgi:hypothetical protein